MQILIRKPYNSNSLEEVLQFASLNGVRPYYPESLIRRFLTELSSSTDLIVDLFQGEKRVAVAVLLDLVENPSKSANLELIGCVKEIEFQSVVKAVLLESRKVLPATRSGIQVGFHESLMPDSLLLESFGYLHLYNTYEMKSSNIRMPRLDLPAGYHWQKLSMERFDEYYSVLSESFKNNIETSIPPLEKMKLSFANQKRVNTTLFLKDDSIIGFTNICPDELNPQEGEVHLIGLLPAQRGQGIGKYLLGHAVEELRTLGCLNLKLTVAAANQIALGLYEKFGFKIDQYYSSFYSESSISPQNNK
jgi:ribosomal protein S18 acetylase RimI-like enzyme